MATSTGVKYIGKNDVYEDNILRTGLTWSKGETHILPDVMAKEFLKHPGMFAEVPGASYLLASSSSGGVGFSRGALPALRVGDGFLSPIAPRWWPGEPVVARAVLIPGESTATYSGVNGGVAAIAAAMSTEYGPQAVEISVPGGAIAMSGQATTAIDVDLYLSDTVVVYLYVPPDVGSITTITAVATFCVNWYYKHRDDTRAREAHEAYLASLTMDRRKRDEDVPYRRRQGDAPSASRGKRGAR